eukprot:jgi/Botrbrau1/5156/Bobra.0172s0028.1
MPRCLLGKGLRYYLYSPNSTSIVTTTVAISTGGTYMLSYWLLNGGGPPNSWRTIVSSVDGSFQLIILDPLQNSSAFDWTYRAVTFRVPVTARVVAVSFEARSDLFYWGVGLVQLSLPPPPPPPQPPSPPSPLRSPSPPPWSPPRPSISLLPDSTASAARMQTGAVSAPPSPGPTQGPPPRASPSPLLTPPLPSPTVCFAAGQNVFPLSAPCWSCVGDYCDLYETSARLGAVGTTSNLTTRLLTPGGGVYRLKYRLQPTAGTPNSWRAVIGSTDGTFPPVVLESFDNIFPYYVDYNWMPMRELVFNIPSRTRAIDVTFVGRHVRAPFPPWMLLVYETAQL